MSDVLSVHYQLQSYLHWHGVEGWFEEASVLIDVLLSEY